MGPVKASSFEYIEHGVALSSLTRFSLGPKKRVKHAM